MDDLIEKIMTTRWTGGMIFVLYLVFFCVSQHCTLSLKSALRY